MQAIVLVGGEGTRLRPLTYGTPKPMVPIMNVPFLAWTFERLNAAGITDVILPAGYMPEAITEYFGDGSALGMKITYVIEEVPLGTAGALKNVQEHITGPFFVLNGDVLTSLDLTAMMAFHKERGGLGALHLIKVDDPSAFGCVVHDANQKIERFVEKPAKGNEPTNEVNAGTYLLEPQVLDMIPAGRNVSIERETFPKILADGHGLYAYTTSDYWIDLGRPEHYLSAHRDVLSGAMPLALEPGVSGAGARNGPQFIAPVHLEGDAFVDPTARVGPDVVLGKGCRIGAGAVIRNSVLWDNVIVEDGVQIEETIVASRCRIGAGSIIGKGSVIGHDVTIEAGTVAEPGARIGASQPSAKI
ncbi:MAG: NDP-sugar synthase [Candidatus Eremiobacteraeota bacterium]|nr:NDP-sugar synthase [Candidatus Eremiobacteraeota bacterium]